MVDHGSIGENEDILNHNDVGDPDAFAHTSDQVGDVYIDNECVAAIEDLTNKFKPVT